MTAEENDDLEDLIRSETRVDWLRLKGNMSNLPTGELVEKMVTLGLYVNKQFAQEIAKRKDAVFWLRKLIQDGQHWKKDGPGDAWSPVHVIHILALIKSEEALDLLLDTFRYHGEDLGDWLTEDGPSLLFACGENAIDRLDEFIEDETLDAFVRNAAITAIFTLTEGNPSRQEKLKKQVVKFLENSIDDDFPTLLISTLCSFHDRSVLPVIYNAFEQGKIDEIFIDLRDVEEIINGESRDIEELRHKRRTKDPLEHFTRENIEYLHSIHYHESITEELPEPESIPHIPPPKKKKKIGRNKPCPCGSGVKYKKCCGKIG